MLVSGVEFGIGQVGWSPSGRWVFWGTLGASNGSGVDLWRIDAAGGDPVRMTVEEHASLQAAWQPILVPLR